MDGRATFTAVESTAAIVDANMELTSARRLVDSDAALVTLGPIRPAAQESIGEGGIRVLPVTSGITIAIWSSKHQLHSSPGSSDRMIG